MTTTRKRGMLYSTFVGGIPFSVSEDEIRDLFSRCGLIQQLYIANQEKKNCKYGFVRYNTPEETLKAVSELHRKLIAGSYLIVDIASDTVDRIKEFQENQKKTVTVNRIECERKNTEVSKGSAKNSKLSGRSFFSVFVGNLDNGVSEGELKDVFSIYGHINSVFIQHNRGTTFGFVNYCNVEEAMEAVQQLNGTTIKDRIIDVELAKRTLCQLPKDLVPPDVGIVSSRDGHRQSKLKLYSVYVSKIHPDVTEKEIVDLFSGCGLIQDMFISSFEDTGKQHGFIRYSKCEHAVNAVSRLIGTRLNDVPINVQYANDTVNRIPKDIKPTKTAPSSEAGKSGDSCQVKSRTDIKSANTALSVGVRKDEKTCQAKSHTVSSTSASRLRDRNKRPDYYSVFVGQLHPDVTKKEIKDLFSGCGDVYDFFLSEAGEDHRYGFIRYSNPESVLNAIAHLNGWKVKNRPIVVDLAHDTAGRLNKGRGFKCVVPSINPDLSVEKLAFRSPEMESVINRSRVHETYSTVRVKLCTFEGGMKCFNKVLEMVDRLSYNNKRELPNEDSCPGSNLSLQDVSDSIKRRTSELTMELFMDKFLKVTKTVENLMAEAKSNPRGKGIPQKPSPRASHSTVSTLRASRLNTEFSSSQKSGESLGSSRSLRNNVVPSPQSPSRNNSSSVSSPAMQMRSCSIRSNSKRLQTSPLSQRPPAKNKKNLSIIDLGRKLRKEMNDERAWQQDRIQLRFDKTEENKFVEKEERTLDISPSWIRKNVYEPEMDEGWGKLTHSEWASDLFCQLLDDECGSPTGTTGSASDCSINSSPEHAPASESSGYSSVYESGDFDCVRPDKPASSRKKCLNSLNTIKNEFGVEKSRRMDLLMKSSLFNIRG